MNELYNFVLALIIMTTDNANRIFFFLPVQRAVIIIINVVDAFSIPISIKVYNMFSLNSNQPLFLFGLSQMHGAGEQNMQCFS